MSTIAINQVGKISFGDLPWRRAYNVGNDRRSERRDGSPIKKAQSSLGVGRLAQAELDAHGREKASDQDKR